MVLYRCVTHTRHLTLHNFHTGNTIPCYLIFRYCLILFSVSWFLSVSVSVSVSVSASALALFQAFSSAQERQERELADLELQRSDSESIRQRASPTQEQQQEEKSDEEMVENMFGFLPDATERRAETRQEETQVTPPRRRRTRNKETLEKVIK